MAEVETIFPTPDRHELELRIGAELGRLPGVITAAAWLAESGRLREVRIHVLPGASSTIIANEASGVLRALRIVFDPDAIRVTTVALPDPALLVSDATGSPRKLVLHDLSLNRTGSHVSCRVQLMHRGSIATGEAHELDTGAGRVRVAASATLRAAETAIERLAHGLEGASITPMFGRSYAVVAVEAAIGRKVANLNGMVAVDPARAPEEAVCLATLRAIDRWLSGS
jgi:hypothetical protein